MITQNPIIGRARKKVSGVYSRVLYGKNVIQTCPPSRKGKETQAELERQSAFSLLQRLSCQLSASDLNQIYYAAPIGRSRRSQWIKDLASGSVKQDGHWHYDPAAILQLGSNPQVSENFVTVTPLSSELVIPLSSFSAINDAIINEVPCIILVCPSEQICISLLDYTSIVGDNVVLTPLSSTLINKECWLFPLWLVNMGTQQHPILAYGSYKKFGS